MLELTVIPSGCSSDNLFNCLIFKLVVLLPPLLLLARALPPPLLLLLSSMALPLRDPSLPLPPKQGSLKPAIATRCTTEDQGEKERKEKLHGCISRVNAAQDLKQSRLRKDPQIHAHHRHLLRAFFAGNYFFSVRLLISFCAALIEAILLRRLNSTLPRTRPPNRTKAFRRTRLRLSDWRLSQ